MITTRELANLTPIYNNQKSFYNKAKKETTEDGMTRYKRLYSYETLVADIVYDLDISEGYIRSVLKEINIYNQQSNTTKKHIREFIQQEFCIELNSWNEMEKFINKKIKNLDK